MRDLIDRQAAIDALHMHLMYRMGTDSNKKRLDEWINNLPSAQPEIIRCRECRHYTFADNRAFGFLAKRCEWTGFERNGKYQSLCLSDMTKEELEANLNPERGEWLKGAAIHLALTLHEIGNLFDIVGELNDEKQIR